MHAPYGDMMNMMFIPTNITAFAAVVKGFLSLFCGSVNTSIRGAIAFFLTTPNHKGSSEDNHLIHSFLLLLMKWYI